MEIKPNLLIVDDELGARQSLEVILEDDYTVFSAVNGLEAIEILQRGAHRPRSPGREHAGHGRHRGSPQNQRAG